MLNIEHRCVLTEWCEHMVSSGNLDEAEQFAKILHEDGQVSSLITLARVVERKNGYSPALKLMEDYTTRESNLEEADLCRLMTTKGIIFANAGDLHSSLAALRHARSLSGTSSDVAQRDLDLKIASLLFSQRDFEAAQTLFNKGFIIQCEDGEVTNSNVVKLKAPEEKKSDATKGKVTDLVWVKPHANCEYVYFVSGDITNCQYFALKLANQIKTLASDNVHLHIHGVITSTDDFGFESSAWKRLIEQLEQVKIGISFTIAALDLPNLSDLEQKSICASERYRILPEIIARYNLPVVTADIGLMPMLDPFHLLDYDFDVGLLEDPSSVLDITSQMDSNLSIFNPSKDALKFATELSDYFNHAYSNKEQLCFGLDRVGLAVTKQMNHGARVKALSQDIIEKRIEYHHPAKLYKTRAHFISRNSEQSERDFANYMQTHKNDFSSLMLARHMGRNGNEAASLVVIEAYLSMLTKASRAERFEALQLKALIHAIAGDLDLSHDCLVNAQKALPNGQGYDSARSVSEYQLASVKAALGQLEDANEIFGRGLKIDCDNGWDTSTSIIDFSDLASTDEALDFENLLHKSDQNSFDCVYLVAADLEYCKQFLPMLINQFETLGSKKVHLHIHGISSSCETQNLHQDWNAIKEMLDRSNIQSTLTIGRIKLKNLTTQKLKSVYASERFRMLPHLLETYYSPVVVADIDQLPLQNPSAILDSNCDFQLIYFPKSVLNFLSVVSATVSTFYPTPKGLQIAKFLKSYIDRAYSSLEKLDWHVDQAALAVAHHLYEDANIGYLNPDIVEKNPCNINPSIALKNGAMFWSVTNSIPGNSEALVKFQREQRAKRD